MITRYDIDEILTDDPNNPLDKYFGTPAAGGGGAVSPTATATPTKRELEGYEKSALRQLWRAGRITEEQWKTELKSRGLSEQQSIDEIGYQKGVGVTNGKLTASEAEAVASYKANAPKPPAAAPTPAAPTGLMGDGNFNWTAAYPGQPTPAAGVGPAGRTVAQIKGTEYLSDAERAWYLQQTGSKAPAASDAASRAATASGTAAAPAKPKGPIPGSKEDLLLKGGIPVGGNITLQGQQYRDTTTVAQAKDGKYYVVDKETGAPVSGPYNTSAEADRNAPLTQLGPAITSNDSARIGSMALAGAGRPLVSPSSGMNAALSLDQIIASTAQRGFQPGDFMGAAQTDFGPVDIARGGVPDYGGMRPVTTATGDATGYTGRINTPNGEIAIGTSAIDQVGTHYGSQAQQAFAPYLSQSQINRLDPAKYDQTLLALQTLREQGAIQQADQLDPSGKLTADAKAQQSANLAALGIDPYDVELFPDIPAYKHGGSLMLDEPTFMVEASGNIVGVAAEGGNKEKVEQRGNSLQFTPMKGKAKYHGGMMTDALGVPSNGRMLTGGTADYWEPQAGKTPIDYGTWQPAPDAVAPDAGTNPGLMGGIDLTQSLGYANGVNIEQVQAQRAAADAERAAQAAIEKAAAQEAQRAMAQAAQDAIELRGRQFEAGRFNAAGMPAPLTISPQFGDAWQYLNAKDYSKILGNRGQAPLGTQWPVGMRPPSNFNPQEIGQEAYRRALESAQGRRRINGSGGMGGYRPSPDDDNFEGPLPGPQPNLPPDPAMLSPRQARRWGVSPLQVRGWGVANRKAPIGAGLQVA